MFEFEKAMSILGIDPSDTMREAKSKYRVLIVKYHPDSNLCEDVEESIEMTQNLNWAYETILKLGMVPEQTFKDISDVIDFFGISDNEINWTGTEKNENAYMERGKFLGSVFGKYFWDPSYEKCGAFTGSIEVAILDLYEKLVLEICGEDINRRKMDYGKRKLSLYTCFFNLFRDRIYYLFQQEFVRPYYCTGKLVEQEGKLPELTAEGIYSLPVIPLNEIDPVFQKTRRKALIGKKPFEFQDAVILTGLYNPSIGNRTETIESLSVGEELKFVANVDHPVYPNHIEAFTLDGRSVGTLPVPYSIAAGRMLANNQIELSAKVTNITTRAQRGPGARVAYCDIALLIHVKLPVLDMVCDNNDKIQYWVDKASNLLRLQKLAKDEIANGAYKNILNDYSPVQPDSVYDKLLFFGGISFYNTDGKANGRKYSPKGDGAFYDLPEDLLRFIYATIEAINDKDTVLHYLEKQIKDLYCIKWDKYSIRLSFSRKKNRKTYEDVIADILIYENRYLLN